ncbi:MAG: DNA mismatch repair endonuclease MutL [Nitrospirae bacterium]|nr:DNA mismatch repair endonuclease MutL [Nitrospirota bacterium]
MPDIIKHLPEGLINKIAAGEVVERPASVLKELVENSIDADSTKISIRVDKGGTTLISVSDNGIGMSGSDANIAFDRHATSKLFSSEDLFNIHTLGFRGEALSSIAAVSRISLKTRERNAVTGTLLEIEGGGILKNTECGCPPGTEIEVRDIFYNVPARKSFLKTVSTEHGHILSTVLHQALSHIGIHFILTGGEDRGKVIFDLPPVEDIGDRVLQIYGSGMSEGLMPVAFDISEGRIYGLASSPAVTFRSRENQLFFVNKRAVKNPSLSHAVQEAYRDLIPRECFPMIVLFIDIAPELVDVNVHPAKREVRFRDSRYVHDMVVEAIRGALQTKDMVHENQLCHPDRYSGFVSGSKTMHSQEFLKQVQEDRKNYRNAAPLSENIIVSEGFNPFSGKNNSQTRDMYSEPLVRILGQTGALFIVAEINGELSIIDQHAAHERVIYDGLRRGYDAGCSVSQALLIPETVELSLDKAQTLSEYRDVLNAIGFDIGEIGDRSFILRSVPEVFTGDNYTSLLINMTDEIKEGDFSHGKGIKLSLINEVVKSLLSRKACHSAVRARGLLTTGEMMSLVNDLLKTDMPYTCPHGRPIVRKFTYDELAGMFGRK